MDELGSGPAAAVVISTTSGADGVPVVTVSGELDISNIDALKARVATVLSTHPERLIFDLGDLRYIDSAGITVLLGAAAETDVQLREPSQVVRRVVELTGLTEVLPITP